MSQNFVTYPNQKIITIKKPEYICEFLQIGKLEWQKAFQELTPTAFAMYLYLAGNKDGYKFALSQSAFEHATGRKKTAYYHAVNELIEKGFIYQEDNHYVFRTLSAESAEQEAKNKKYFDLWREGRILEAERLYE